MKEKWGIIDKVQGAFGLKAEGAFWEGPMNSLRIAVYGIFMVGFLLASSGCYEWSHWDRHGYDSDQTRYDRNDRGGFREDTRAGDFPR